jgi:hypothetical protein
MYLLRSIILLLSQEPIDGVVGHIVVGVVDAGIQAITVPRNDTTKSPLGLGQLAFRNKPKKRALAHIEIRGRAIRAQQARG